MPSPNQVQANTNKLNEKEAARQYIIDCIRFCKLNEFRNSQERDQSNLAYEDEQEFFQLAKKLKEDNTRFENSVLSQYPNAQNMLGEMYMHAVTQAKVYMRILSKEIKNSIGFNPADLKANLKSFVKEKLFFKYDDPEIALPVFTHFVEVNDQGVLSKDTFSFLTTVMDEATFKGDLKDKAVAKKTAFFAKMNTNLDTCVKEWLDREGYEKRTVNNEDKIYLKGDNNPLDKKAFAALRDNPITGLTTYLKDKWDTDVELKEEPRSPRP